jgi:hypothetical protein
MTDKRKQYQREWARRKRAEAKTVDKPVDGGGVDAVIVDKFPWEETWDKNKYPVRGAWEIACERAERAMMYVDMFPEHVRPSEKVFQTVAWQYEHEGVPAVRKAA